MPYDREALANAMHDAILATMVVPGARWPAGMLAALAAAEPVIRQDERRQADKDWQKASAIANDMARADERERCARIAEECNPPDELSDHDARVWTMAIDYATDAIRAGAPAQPNASGGHTQPDPAWEKQFSQPEAPGDDDVDTSIDWDAEADAEFKTMQQRAEAAEAEVARWKAREAEMDKALHAWVTEEKFTLLEKAEAEVSRLKAREVSLLAALADADEQYGNLDKAADGHVMKLEAKVCELTTALHKARLWAQHECLSDRRAEDLMSLIDAALSPAPAPVIDLEKRANEMMLERDVALRRVALLEEAFMWTGGSADFAPGGQAYVGWMKWRDELGLSPAPAQQVDMGTYDPSRDM